MSKFKAWISAARLRTLPLSVSGIIVGASLGNRQQILELTEYSESKYDGLISFVNHGVWGLSLFWLAILTTIGFQVLSNFANDYGDGLKGTDDKREGEKRLIASGIILPKQMKHAMVLTTVITLGVAIALIYKAFGREDIMLSILFFGLGVASVVAAIKYTVGKNAYGYSGLGDVFVFLFFGVISVLGSYFIFTHNIQWELILPATCIGLLSMAVLNLNNMRDFENDARHNKRTMVVKIGMKKAKIYHYSLLIIAMLSAFIYTLLHYRSPEQFIYSIAFIPLLLNMKAVYYNKEPRLMDSELKKVALSTFLFAILFSLLH